MKITPLVAAALATLALMPLAWAETTQLSAGPATLTIAGNDVPHCIAASPLFPCPLGWDNNNTLNPSDDSFYQHRAVDEVGVGVEGTPVSQSIHLDLGKTRVNHTLFARISDALVETEAGLPSNVGDHTSTNTSSTHADLMLHSVGLNGTQPAPATYHIVLLAPEGTDRNGTGVPHGVGGDGVDSDAWVASQIGGLLALCIISQLGGEHALTCHLVPSELVLQHWAEWSPRVVVGFALHRAVVDLGSMAMQEQLPSLSQDGPPNSQANSSGSPFEPSRQLLYDALDIEHAPISTPGVPRVGHHPAASLASQLAEGMEARAWHWWWAAALLLPLLALLHYITGAKALHNRQRTRLLGLARAHPGILVGEAAKRLGLSFHSAAHHARILKRAGHVEIVRAGRNLAIYPVGSVPLRHRQALVSLRRGPQARALEVVRTHPRGRLPDLAAAMGCTKSSAHAKLASLRAAGYLTWDRRSGYDITPQGLEALALLERDRAAVALAEAG